MNKPLVFIDRRKGNDRRNDVDPCKHLPVDLFHRKRRKSADRRDASRSLTEDYYAFLEASFDSLGQQGEGSSQFN